jgi:hypothetical protein
MVGMLTLQLHAKFKDLDDVCLRPIADMLMIHVLAKLQVR